MLNGQKPWWTGLSDFLTVAAGKVSALEAVVVEKTPAGKDEAHTIYRNIGKVTSHQTGVEVEFYNSAFKKNHKDDGLFEKAIPGLKSAFENAVLAYSEKDDLGGTVRKDGTVHKAHPNVDTYDNYVGKVAIDGTECYVHYTVTNEKGNKNGTHSMFVTDVEVYENTVRQMNDTEIPSGRTSSNGVMDAKLRSFFLLASDTPLNFARRLKYATGWERGADGKWRYEVPDFEVDPSSMARRGDALWRRPPWAREYDALLDKVFVDEPLTEAEEARYTNGDSLIAPERWSILAATGYLNLSRFFLHHSTNVSVVLIVKDG